MADLGFRSKTGVLPSVNLANPFSPTGWIVQFTPKDLSIQEAFVIYHIAVQGPNLASCNLQLWLDTTFYSATVRGDINDYDPNQPIPVKPGQNVNLYWDTAVNPAPLVTVFCRQPSPI